MTFDSDVFDIVYEQVKQQGFDKAHIYPEDLYPAIKALKPGDNLAIEQVARSFEGREIYRIQLGNGPKQVLAWSQMHGDEPTATASLMDLVNFVLSDTGRKWLSQWSDKISLHILPMLNPDGAHYRTRQNAQGIDINRDANALQSPEGQILHQIMKQTSPAVAFNLHDQNRYYTVGENQAATVVAFMAPPPDPINTITPARADAMHMIGLCVDALRPYIRGKMARYDDSYSYRAFGDFMAAQGTSCILIESGTEPGDPHRQIARKMNVLAIVNVIQSLCHKDDEHLDLAKYTDLPLNVEDGISDLIIRDIGLQDRDGKRYTLDVNIELDLINHSGIIKKLGECTRTKAYFDFEGKGLEVLPNRTYILSGPLSLDNVRYLTLLRQGYTQFTGDSELLINTSEFPVALNEKIIHNKLRLIPGQNATFCMGKAGEPGFTIVNGVIIDLVRGVTINTYDY